MANYSNMWINGTEIELTGKQKGTGASIYSECSLSSAKKTFQFHPFILEKSYLANLTYRISLSLAIFWVWSQFSWANLIKNKTKTNEFWADVSIYKMSRNSLPTYHFPCCCLVAKSCQTLWDSMDCSPPDSSVRGISQARILDSVAISFSRPLFLHKG